MSSILFQYNTEGCVVDRNIFTKMFSVLDHRGSDGRNIVYLDKAALGHQRYWITPEEVNEIQPILNSGGDCFILFDGRLDNRDELINKLNVSKDCSDANVILKLYSKYNTDFFSELMGSYVFLVYDNLKKRVVAVRDHLGDEVLYYYFDGKKLIIASEPLSIIQHPDIPLEYNDKKISEFFSLIDHTDHSSFFKNIYEILPAHYMLFEGSDLKLIRYWDLNPKKTLRYSKDEEYADHLKSILQKSVECRLRTIGDPGVMMSGGIDSTSLAALATENLIKGKKLKTFSYVFDKFKESDETKYIDDFSSKYGVENIKISGDDCWTFNNFESWPVNPAFPYQDPVQWLKIKLFKKVRKNGIRTVLTGWFADQLFIGADYFLRDYISDYKFFSSITNIAKIWGNGGIKNLRTSRPIRILLRPLKPVRGAFFKNTIKDKQFPWLTEYSKSLLPGRTHWSDFTRDFYRREQAVRVAGLSTSLDASACPGCYHGGMLDLRTPFRDRRVVEFFFQIPSYQLYEERGYKDKLVLRNALRNHLPESILNRTSITSLGGLFYYGIEKNINLIRDLIYNYGFELEPFIDMKLLNNILSISPKEMDTNEFYLLWNSLCLIIWKNRLEESKSCLMDSENYNEIAELIH